MEKKVYILTVSDYFPAYHPKRGESTGFEYKIKNGIKIHTIRENYAFWKNRIDNINAGLAILSIRRWFGNPYRSKSEEIIQLDKVGIQALTFEKVEIMQPDKAGEKVRDGDRYANLAFADNYRYVDPITLAENDGLSHEDFRDWFKSYNLEKYMALIHFTEFRY